MKRADLVSFVPVLCGALLLLAVESRSLRLTPHVAAAPSETVAHTDDGARSAAFPGPMMRVGWPDPGARLTAGPDSKVRIRLGDGATPSRAIGSDLTGVAECGEDRMPIRLELSFALNSFHSLADELVREVVGVHRASRFEFVGERVESRERPAAGGVVQLRFDGTARVGATARRLVVALECLPGFVEPVAVRAIGIGTILASDFGLSEYWGLGPWSGERCMTVVWDLAFEPAKE